MKRNLKSLTIRGILLPIMGLIIFISSCKNEERQREDQVRTQPAGFETQAAQDLDVRIYSGDIGAINVEANQNREVSGTISIRVEGNLMRFFVTAEGLEPDIMHMQYLQTSATGEPVQCPDASYDVNKDGIIDIEEASPQDRGARIIPLHMGPSTLEMNIDSYPRTNINGQLQFSRTVSMDSLRQAVKQEYGIENLDFSNFTYLIQGVAQGTSLPATTATRGGVDAQQSIPVGCAKLTEE